MPKPSTVSPSAAQAAAPAVTPAAASKCRVIPQPDGALQVQFLIDDPVVVKRLALRANGMLLEQYLWDNILNRAITDHVY